jgi:phosphoglycerol transferase MdoB-like AlkP superfamily enzyme
MQNIGKICERWKMSKFSGFVPIRFRIVGYLFLITGVVCLLLVGLASLTGWFALPQVVLVYGLVAVPLSLYLIFVPPKE